MTDNKSKNQLIEEFESLRQVLTESKVAGSQNKRVKEILGDEDSLYRLLAQNVTDVIWVMDMTLQFVYVSPSVTRMLGYSPEEALTKRLEEGLTPDSLKIVLNVIKEELPLEYTAQNDISRSRTLELEVIRKDGSTLWTETRVTFLREPSHQPIGIIGVIRDITERKQMEEELRASEIRFRGLAESLPSTICETDARGNLTFVNDIAFEVFKYTREDFEKGLNISQMLIPKDRDSVRDICQRVLNGEKIGEIEYTAQRKDGSTFPAIVYASSIARQNGPTGIRGLVADITKRKRVEKLLRTLNKASLSVERAITVDEVFHAVAEEFKQVGLSCLIYRTDESQSMLFIEHLSCDPKTISTLNDMMGSRVNDIQIPIEDIGSCKEVIWKKESIFVDNVEATIRKLLTTTPKRNINQIVKLLKSVKCINAPLIAKDKVIGMLSVHSETLNEADVPAVTAFAHQVAAAWLKAQLMQDLESSLTKLKQAEEERLNSLNRFRDSLGGIARALATAVEKKDLYTAGHQERVAQLSCAIAKEMGLPYGLIEGLHIAASVHDIGKINIPADLLSKPSVLTDIEFALIKSHPLLGYEVLREINFPWPVAKIVLQHHERIDGSGYPNGLWGKDILLEARILSVADVVEAMSSHRPYRPAHTLSSALNEISQKSGILYDPEVVDTCVKLFTIKKFEFKAGTNQHLHQMVGEEILPDHDDVRFLVSANR